MKNNWMQIITLALCAVLLAVTVLQGRKLEKLRDETRQDLANLEQHLENELDHVSDRFAAELEKTEKYIKDYSFTPVGVDAESEILTAEAALELKSWRADTVVTLLATVEGKETSQELTVDGDGICRGQILVPLDEESELVLHALVNNGGEVKREQIGAWGSVSMLLPLQQRGGGWSGPEYLDGRLRSDFSVSVEPAEWYRGKVLEPVFHVCRNGTLVQELEAVFDANGYTPTGYSHDGKDNWWSVDCKPGDTIEVYLICKDEYGLSYEFHFSTWNVTPEGMPETGTAGAWAVETYS